MLSFLTAQTGEVEEIPEDFFQEPELVEPADDVDLAEPSSDDPLNQLIREEGEEQPNSDIQEGEASVDEALPVEESASDEPAPVYFEPPEEAFVDDGVQYQAAERFQFRFQKNEAGAYVLTPFVEVELAREINGREISYRFGSTPYGQKERRLGIAMESTKEVLQDSQSETVAAVKLPRITPPVRLENCEDNDLVVELIGEVPTSVYVGIYCELDENQVLKFWISAPSDLTWGQMSLFELAGKGERWRAYSVDNFAPIVERQLVGSFSYSFEAENFELRLFQDPNADLVKEAEIKEKEISVLKTQSQMMQSEAQRLQEENKELQKTVDEVKEQNKYFHASFMLGGGMISVKTNTGVSESSFQPAVAFDISTIDLFYSIGAGARVKYVLPPGSSDLYDISAGIQSSWEFGQFKIRPGLGYHTFSNDVSSEGLAFRHSSIGLDLYAQYGKTWQVWSLLSGSGYLPTGDSQYLSVQAGYRRPFNQFFLWGAELTYQRTAFSDVSGTFQQILFSGSINY